MNEAIVFEIWGDLGHFKKYYTTSSPLTFAFPPPPTVRGMLGAVVGEDKDQYLKTFSHTKCRVGVQIVNPVNKVRMGINHINTKGKQWTPAKGRSQIRTEFVRNCRYRIFVSHEDKKYMDLLEQMLRNHRTVFTLSLGLSELLADFSFLGRFKLQLKRNQQTELVTVAPFSVIQPNSLKFLEGRQYFKEKMPLEMQLDRVVSRYEDVLFEANGRSILAVCFEFYQTEAGENIVFM